MNLALILTVVFILSYLTCWSVTGALIVMLPSLLGGLMFIPPMVNLIKPKFAVADVEAEKERQLREGAGVPA